MGRGEIVRTMLGQARKEDLEHLNQARIVFVRSDVNKKTRHACLFTKSSACLQMCVCVSKFQESFFENLAFVFDFR